MHPQVILIVAQQRIADLHRAADHDRLVHTATTATSSHAVPAPSTPGPRQSRSCAGSAAVFRSRLHDRLEPREGQAGDCK
jgi:hypothetical protein